MAFPNIGLRAVMEMAGFNRGFKAYDKAIRKMDTGTEDAAGGISKAFKVLGAGVGAIGVGAGTAIAGIGAAALKLATDAAPLEAVGDAFRGLGGDIEALREGSLGLATDAELMKSFNQAASLVSEDFAKKLPDAMQFLTKVSASTGESMDFMINSLVKGVGRLSPMILDNLGVQVSLAEGTANATKELGKQASELTKAEQQAGIFNVTLEKLRKNTEKMPDITGNAATKMGQLQTQMKNLGDNLGVALLPALSELLGILGPFVTDVGPAMIEFAKNLAGAFIDGVEAIQAWTRAIGEAQDEAKATAEIFREGERATAGYKDATVAAGDQMSLVPGRAMAISRSMSLAAAGIEEVTLATEDATPALAGLDEGILTLGQRIEETRTGLAGFQAQGARLAAEATQIFRQALDEEDAFFRGTSANLTEAETQMRVASGQFAVALLEGSRKAFADFSMQLPEIMASIEGMTVSHNDRMLAIVAEGSGRSTEEQFNASLRQQIAEAEFQARLLQMENEFQARRRIIEATGDEQALAQLELAHQRETANASQNFAESQARSEFNEAVQQQIRERSQIIQRITQQKAHIAELEGQKEFIRASLEAAVIKAEAAGSITKQEAETILKIVGSGQIAQLQNQEQFTIEATRLANKWASGQIGAAQSTVAAYERVQQALDGQIDAAKIGLFELEQDLAAFEIELPPLVLPELPSFPEIETDIGDVTERAGREAVERAGQATQRAAADATSAIARAMQSARKAIEETIGFEIPEGFDEGLEQLGFATVRLAQKWNALWVDFSEELTGAGAAAPATQALGGAIGSIVGGIRSLIDLTADDFVDFDSKLDWLGFGAVRLAQKWNALWLGFEKELTQAAAASEASSALGKAAKDITDGILAITKLETKDFADFDVILDLLGHAAVATAQKFNAIWVDFETELTAGAEASPALTAVGNALKAITGGIQSVLDLAEEDFEGIDFEEGGIWDTIKKDVATLATDIATWDADFPLDTIQGVTEKLQKVRGVTSLLNDIIQDIRAGADVGGLDVSAARGIMAQFNQLLAGSPFFAAPFSGLGPPGGGAFVPPEIPPTGGGGAAGGMGTITIRGSFDGPGGETLTFNQEWQIGTDVDINLGNTDNPDYAV